MGLRVVTVGPLEVREWQRIHNEIIATAPLSLQEVGERLTRHRLTLAYDDNVLVGNATVRPPTDGASTATVIVRILPQYRRRGLGSAYLGGVLSDARAMGAQRIETVVLASNEDGLSFARRHGFVEFDRYTLDGQTVPFVDLYLAES
jgi:GNAT superfamily N-acetyltransferase